MLRHPLEGARGLSPLRRRLRAFFGRRGKLPLLLSFAAFSLVAFGACKTPAPPLTLTHTSQALPEGRDFYFFLSVTKNRDFLTKFFKESGLASRGSDYLLANSRILYGAASVSLSREPRFVLAAEGDYSKSLVEFGIGLESGWESLEREAGTGKFRAFREKSSGFEIAIPDNRLMLLAWGSTEESLRRLASPTASVLAPDTAAEFETHAAAAFLPTPAETVVSLASPMAPAFNRLFLFADRGNTSYELSGRLSYREERDGRVLSAVLKLFLADKLAEQGTSFEEIRKTPQGGTAGRSPFLLRLQLPRERSCGPSRGRATKKHEREKLMTIGVMDYKAGNIRSVETALRHFGMTFTVSDKPEVLEKCDKLIIPGDGEALAAMTVLNETGLGEVIRSAFKQGKPILGICIGCQIVLERSEERNAACLGLIPGVVKLFPKTAGLKVPHMGWNQVHHGGSHPIFAGVPEDSACYFVHSYYPVPRESKHAAATTGYGLVFASAISRDSLVALQFHPEKSAAPGLKMVENFAKNL